MSTIGKIAPVLFEDDDFAIVNRKLFDQYVEYRIHGYHSSRAFGRVFGEDNQDGHTHLRIECLEHSTYYRTKFAQRLKDIKNDDLWGAKKSLNGLLSIARDPFAKDAVRLNAIKELNVMMGITVVDENGKTKAGRTLSDFYRQKKMAPRTIQDLLAGDTDMKPEATDDSAAQSLPDANNIPANGF
jgi:hypothetical protein